MKQIPLLVVSGLVAFASVGCATDNSSEDPSAASKLEQSAAEVGEKTGDAAITAKIKSKLLADKEAPGLKINVTTNGGIVTLEGNVKSTAEKQRAEEIARNTDGVTDVKNLLTSPAG